MAGCSIFIGQRMRSRTVAINDAAVVGASRTDVIAKLGEPTETATVGGRITDTYEYAGIAVDSHKPNQPFMYGLGIGLLLDVSTLGAFEALSTPMALLDTVEDRCKCRITYGPDGRIEKVEWQSPNGILKGSFAKECRWSSAEWSRLPLPIGSG